MELDDDDRFQDRQWKVQRVAWAILALVPFAGLTGIFGHGVLSTRREEAGPLTVTYEHFARRTSATSLRVRMTPAGQDSPPLRLRIDRPYLEAMHTTHILPEPTRVRSSSQFIELEFEPLSSHVATDITIELRPSAWGRIDGRIRVAESPPIVLRHFIWP